MCAKLTVEPKQAFGTFMNFPLCLDFESLKADVAFLGLPFGDPYSAEEITNDQTNAPTAVRRASQRLSVGLDHWDFDIDGPLLHGQDLKVVDCGDVPADQKDLAAHYPKAEAAARAIFRSGAMLCAIGGDHGVPIPVFRALEEVGPVTLVHIDAHLDWRDEVRGVREGYSSPIRRASEMPWIETIHQIGIRAQGSARAEEVEAAKAYGADITLSYDVLREGMQPVLDRIPDGKSYYLTIDADGMDPSVMPAVEAPAPGGLLFHHARDLIHGLVSKGRLLGMDVVEIVPRRDFNEITSICAGRLFINAIGAAAKAGQFQA